MSEDSFSNKENFQDGAPSLTARRFPTVLPVREQNCGNCIFSRSPIGPDGKTDLTQRVCKFEPPKTFPIAQQGGGLALVHVRPGVHPTDWCGKWKMSDLL